MKRIWVKTFVFTQEEQDNGSATKRVASFLSGYDETDIVSVRNRVDGDGSHVYEVRYVEDVEVDESKYGCVIDVICMCVLALMASVVFGFLVWWMFNL